MVSVRPRWWLERSRAERFDISLRWPLYVLCCAEPLLGLLITLGEREIRLVGAAIFLLLTVVHAVANLLLLRAGVGTYLGGPRAGTRLVVPAADLAFPRFTWAPGDQDLRLAVLMVMGGFLTLALTPMLRAGTLLAVVAAGSLVAGGLTAEVSSAVAYGYSVALVAFTCRVSVWTLRLGWEIDRSRAVTAQLAIAEERLRFARDLHDTLGRNLSLVAVQSELAAALATRGDTGAADQMLDVRRIAHESLREMRAVVSAYRSTNLDSELAGAQSVLRAAGVTCRVIGDGSALPAETQTALGWVVREATTNILHHSNATSCKIELDVTADATTLRIENDGREGGGVRSGRGHGLVGLRERLGEVGGSLNVEEGPGRFVLLAWLPVPA
jgi:two-component system sensor histidine kinase DesK